MDKIFIDIETTGLDSNSDEILEVAAAVITRDLSVDYYESCVSVEESSLNKMNDWCKETHHKSGLIEDVRRTNKNIKEVEKELINFLNTAKIEKPVLAGSSVHFDRSFLENKMPDFMKLLHYRNFDVSTLVEFFELSDLPTTKHRALSDIRRSIGIYLQLGERYGKCTK